MAGDTNTGGNVDFALVRYGLDGTLDAGFWTGGVATTPIGSGSDRARAMAVQSDGRVVMAGHSDRGGTQNDFAVARYNGDQPLDTTPPDTTITAGPVSLSADTTPTFEFSADETDATFACQLDGGLFAPCDSPHTTAELAGGSHAVAVTATDLAGNRDPSPATMTFRVCTGPLSGLAIELDRLLRPIHPKAADGVLQHICTD